MSVTVMGSGTWGTALAILLANKGVKVILWSKIEAEIKALGENRKVIKNLPGAELPESVELTLDEKYAVSDSNPEIIVFAVASPYVRDTAKLVAPYIKKGQIIVNVAKGIEEKTLSTLTDILHQEIPDATVAVLSGPSHAEEVSRLIPTTVVVASTSEEAAKKIQDIFMTKTFRVYTSDDVIGVELGGSLKNVIALAAGMSDGLGYGDNTKAALMTRGIAEISRLGKKMGANIETLCGLSGVGDLFVTATSHHSRNWNAGYLIGQGMSTEAAMEKVQQVVEGVHCAKAAKALADKYEVEMPIVQEVYDILFNGQDVHKAVGELFTRDKTNEHSAVDWDYTN